MRKELFIKFTRNFEFDLEKNDFTAAFHNCAKRKLHRCCKFHLVLLFVLYSIQFSERNRMTNK